MTIRCLGSSINLPVTPETTPKDILYSSANLMTHRIDPKASIVVECFQPFGLERRLRRYERVRDVLKLVGPRRPELAPDHPARRTRRRRP